MRKIIFLIGAFISLVCLKIHANNSKINNDSVARQLFIKSEKVAIPNRSKIEKMRFMDPIERNILFFKIVRKESPDLIDNTNKYKYSLINLFTDKSIRKDGYSNLDICNILSNLCIDDYIDVTDSIYTLVKRNKLDFEILNCMIEQDFNVSNELAKKYENFKSIQFLKKLTNEIEQGKYILPKKNNDFVKFINSILSGEEWRHFIKDAETIQPPIFNHKDCK